MEPDAPSVATSPPCWPFRDRGALFGAVASGQLDGDLPNLIDVVNHRMKTMAQKRRTAALARVALHDRVRIGNTVKPQYLRGDGIIPRDRRRCRRRLPRPNRREVHLTPRELPSRDARSAPGGLDGCSHLGTVIAPQSVASERSLGSEHIHRECHVRRIGVRVGARKRSGITLVSAPRTGRRKLRKRGHRTHTSATLPLLTWFSEISATGLSRNASFEVKWDGVARGRYREYQRKEPADRQARPCWTID